MKIRLNYWAKFVSELVEQYHHEEFHEWCLTDSQKNNGDDPEILQKGLASLCRNSRDVFQTFTPRDHENIIWILSYWTDDKDDDGRASATAILASVCYEALNSAKLDIFYA